MACPVKQFYEHGSQERQSQQPQSPGARHRVSRQHQEADREQVLNDEDADRNFCVERRALPAFLDDLHGEHRARKRQREGQCPCRRMGFHSERRNEKAGQKDHRHGQHNRDQHVGGGGAPDLNLRQLPQVQLETDSEQKQGDAEIRQRTDRLDVAHPGLVRGETGQQESQKGRVAKAAEHQSGQECDEQQNRDHGWNSRA